MSKISVKLDINEKLFQKDPQETDLGRNIVRHSILLIDELGFEKFNFKKLAERIKSTEASIYRYFENKHNLLIYLLNWYWEWMKVRIDFNTININDPIQKLDLTINIIVDTANRNTTIDFVDEDILHRIVVAEGTKAYHTKSVDKDNEEGFFLSYKSLCQKVADIILEINPNFPYPRALASTLIEMSNNNQYFAEHLPRLTDIQFSKGNVSGQAIELLKYFAYGAIYSNHSKVKAPNGHVKFKSHS